VFFFFFLGTMFMDTITVVTLLLNELTNYGQGGETSWLLIVFSILDLQFATIRF